MVATDYSWVERTLSKDVTHHNLLQKDVPGAAASVR
jgi:hypothetical protein